MARERRRSTFTARDPGFAAKLEMAPPISSTPQISSDNLVTDPAVKAPAEKGEGLTQVRAPEKAPVPEPDEPRKAGSRTINDSPSARAATPGNPPIRIYFGWPEDIVNRAKPWAEKARCDVKVLLQKAWADAKPEITTILERGIKHADVPVGRVSSSTVRLDTSLKLSDEAFRRLQSEIDPENMVGLSSPLSRWVRDQMLLRANTFLERAGY